MKKNLIIFLILIFSVLSFSGIFYNPPKELYEKETEHFKFIFEPELYYIFDEINAFSDSLFQDYSEFYDVEIKDRINVYILDDVDIVNSFAVSQINSIRIYINAPSDNDGLQNGNDWFRFVFSHELNHIFYGNSVKDWIIKWIPSNFIKNTIASFYKPSYLHEGLSIFMESKYFKGRFDNDMFNMFVRAEIYDNDFPRYYLGGASPDLWTPAGFNYIYGEIIVKEIYSLYGEDVLRDIIFSVDSSFFSDISSAFEKITNNSWDEFLDRIKSGYFNNIDTYESMGYTFEWNKTDDSYQNTDNLKTDGESIYGYFEKESEIKKGVYRDNELIIENVRKFDVSYDKNIAYLVYTSDGNEAHSKLFLKCECPFSDTLIAERVSEFGFSGDNLVYTVRNKGLIGLFYYNMKTKKTSKILDYGRYVINSVTGNGSDVFFSMNSDGKSDIFRYNFQNMNIYRVTDDDNIEIDLFLYENYIYYSSNYDGIYNIYRIDLETLSVERVTDHITGAFSPVILKGKLYYLYYDSQGYHLSYKDYGAETVKTGETIEQREVFISGLYNVIYGDNKYELNKYFEKPGFSFSPSFDIIGDEYYYGGGISVLGEALNYSGEIGLNTNMKKVVPYMNLEFEYYFNNKINMKYYEGYFYSNYNISKSFNYFAKKSIYTGFRTDINFKNFNFENASFGGYYLSNLYSYKGFSMYDYRIDVSLSTTGNAYFGISKPFYMLNTKFEPVLSYQKIGNSGDIMLNLSTTSVLFRPYMWISDGKYRFDGLKLFSGTHYSLKENRIKIDSIGVYFELVFFYNYKIDLPLMVPSVYLP